MKSRSRNPRKETYSFTAVIHHAGETDWLIARNPETGTTTQGKTFKKALANLREATELYLSEFPHGPHGKSIVSSRL